MARRSFFLAILTVFSAACSEPGGTTSPIVVQPGQTPQLPPPLLSLSSAPSDTIGALQDVVASATSENGIPRAGIEVEFSLTSKPGDENALRLIDPSNGTFTTTVTARTDATGAAHATLRHGLKTGALPVVATLPAYGIEAERLVTTDPGGLVFIILENDPRGGAVYTTGTSMRVVGADRRGNARPHDDIILHLVSGPASLRGDSIRGEGPGRAVVDVTAVAPGGYPMAIRRMILDIL
jgi:hypothetical protein